MFTTNKQLSLQQEVYRSTKTINGHINNEELGGLSETELITTLAEVISKAHQYHVDGGCNEEQALELLSAVLGPFAHEFL